MPLSAVRSQSIAPAATADGGNKEMRSDQFGAAHIRNELLAWCEEAAYYKATNPTMGTGLAMGIQTTFSDTANVLAIMRNGSASKLIIPHYLRLTCTGAGATTTSSHIAIITDTANRWSSGGTDLTAEVKNARSDQAPASAVDVLRFGAITALAQSAKRQLIRAPLKTQAAPCWVVGDEVVICFSAMETFTNGLKSGAAASVFVVSAGPLILGGQNHCVLFHMWNPANATTAPSWECEFAWWERGKA